MDSMKLRGAIAEKGLSQSVVARKINMHPNTLSSRMLGKSQFTVNEAASICDILGISDDCVRARIFLLNNSPYRD